MRTRSLKGIGLSEEKKAQIQNLLSVRHFGIVGEKGSGSRSTGSGRLHLYCCTVVVSLLSCVSSSSPTNPMQHSDQREREIERSSGAARWNTVVATTFVAERTAYCAIHGKRRRRQNKTRSAIVAAIRYHSKSVDFSRELVLNARTLASYSSSWSVGRTSPGSSRLTNVIVECEDDSRELQDPELMGRLDMAGRKVLLVWKIPRPIAEGSSKTSSTLCLLGGGGRPPPPPPPQRRLLRDGRE